VKKKFSWTRLSWQIVFSPALFSPLQTKKKKKKNKNKKKKKKKHPLGVASRFCHVAFY